VTQLLTRRNFLKGLGAAAIIVTGGMVWRAIDSGVLNAGQGPAYEPWTNWRDEQHPQMNLIRAAILASNPHNSQPWLFRLTDRQIDLYADTHRNIGTIDPFLREMTIGAGAALANVLLAARATGYQPDLRLMPSPDDATHMARVELSPNTPDVSPLYEAIPRRHTDRAAFDITRMISQTQLDDLCKVAAGFEDVKLLWVTEPQIVQNFRDQTLAATQAIINDEQQSADSFAWQRSNWRELQEKRDGLTYDAQGMGGLITAAVKMLPTITKEQADQGWYEALRDRQLATASAFGLILARDPLDNVQRINVGRLWQLLHLQMTVDGLGAQPLNQLAERRDREMQLGLEPRFGRALSEIVGDDRWSALMPFRVGYPTMQSLPSPRRDPQTFMV
jgi:hypothetical protein